jgi:ABC-type phosphate/phosphonate transport system substrate-binding protein
MYDMPHARSAVDALWERTRFALGDGPQTLTRDKDVWDIWRDPDLLLAQTCGLPYRARLHGHVRLVGTPDYDLPDCPAGHYFSVLIVHRDDHAETLSDLSGRTMAYNEALSQSGWAAPCAYFARHDLAFKTGLQTGGHALSARAVDEGQADFASLDAVTWAMLRNEAPALTDRLRVVARTDPTPGLPYITALTQNAPRVARAVSHAIESLEPAHKQTLFLKELVQIPADAYLGLPLPPLP